MENSAVPDWEPPAYYQPVIQNTTSPYQTMPQLLQQLEIPPDLPKSHYQSMPKFDVQPSHVDPEVEKGSQKLSREQIRSEIRKLQKEEEDLLKQEQELQSDASVDRFR
jgi:hypothetical protein